MIDKKSIKKYILAVPKVILLSLIAYFALVLVYCIPTDGRIEKNMQNSVSFFENESDYPQFMDNYNSRLDNWTDSTMLLTASCDENKYNPFISSLMNGNVGVGGLYPSETLVARYSNNYKKGDIYFSYYQRYWHGYLVVLKPLLWLFNYGTIRSILSFVHLFLFISVLYYLKERRYLFFPFLVLFLFWNPTSLSLSLQFSTISIITMSVCLFLLKHNDKITQNKLEHLFLFVGALTSFIDFLTYPIVTLGVPLILYIALNNQDKKRVTMKKLIATSIMWFIGYAVMWSMKWVLATLITDQNIIKDAIENVLYRTSTNSDDGKFTYFDTLYRNLGCSFQYPWFIMVLIYVYYLINISIKNKGVYKESLLPLVFVGLYPFIWALVVQNHTYSHCFFVYRIFSISVFAFTVYVSLFKKYYTDKMIYERK